MSELKAFFPKHLVERPDGNGLIPHAKLFEEFYPDQIKNFPATEEERKKMPNLLYWRRYGDYKPTAICGPPITASEERKMVLEKIVKRDTKKGLAKTRKDVKSGSQKKIQTFFAKKGQKAKKK